MPPHNINDILAFVAVAREQSFTRAAHQLGVSQSALSHTIRGLEERLGTRLLARTTRSVSPTEAGERLLHTVAPRLEEIEAELNALGALRGKPAGSIRLVCDEYALHMIIWPKLMKFLKQYPDIRVEATIEHGKHDIVPKRYDAGIALHEYVAKDMIAVPVAPDLRIAVVGAPSYFAAHPRPKSPRDLLNHNCINLRLPSHDGFCDWEFEKNGKLQRLRVDGQLVFNGTAPMLDAALAGLGLAYLPEEMVKPHIAKKRLMRVLEEWCLPFAGYHLYYPSRRHASPAFALFIDAMRYRG